MSSHVGSNPCRSGVVGYVRVAVGVEFSSLFRSRVLAKSSIYMSLFGSKPQNWYVR